ncbi:hypothetical protein DFJ64_3310 [Thermasporomyces composti]|uniref:Uncharacterized protein n=1 Tax=Thermasporomyces composti TaxID=696763 RepID=A0A3D9V8P7_THECX|nr:hypothetical protein DFJ64_3310 [Thermasporomyces composti]
MTMTPPGPPGAQPPASPGSFALTSSGSPDDGRSGGVSRAVLIGLGVVLFLVAGVGAFVAARSYRLVQLSQPCGSYRCIPQLEIDAVTEALREQGHTCKQEHIHIDCDLRIGMVHFETTLSVADNRIHTISSSIFRADSDPITKTGLAYLGWFATLPYRDDPATSAEIQKWLAESVEANKDTKATIGDYEYVLTHPETYEIVLRIEGKS